MKNKANNEGRQFAIEFLNDIKHRRIMKDCMINHSEDFTGGMEELHRKRFNTYLGSCGCYLMDRRLNELEGGYRG